MSGFDRVNKSGSSNILPGSKDLSNGHTTNVRVNLDMNAVSRYFSTKAQNSQDVRNNQSNKLLLQHNSCCTSTSRKDPFLVITPSKASNEKVSLSFEIIKIKTNISFYWF